MMGPGDVFEELSVEERGRWAALLGASQVGRWASSTLDAGDLVVLAEWILTGQSEPLFPYLSGDFVVLGPECTLDPRHHVITWKGGNYYLHPALADQPDDQPDDLVDDVVVGGPDSRLVCSHCPKVPRERLQPCPWEGCPHRDELWPNTRPQLERDELDDVEDSERDALIEHAEATLPDAYDLEQRERNRQTLT